ncbi:MAG: C-GCAxxG-C-C family protein [Clostridiales bacterium]|jgi:C_GCAxxG_C_C family probable redox protein|nr:C-GCAxxG-C-C family protein [Clostridiales bacterium]MDD2572859.1 C-GCAxxG-C-C family protein [Eubacteriales bacterium]MDY0119259.1 C-GCAxxG-C-C family protein [Clostridia bacterium]NLG30136.1 C_GCAxxG_C_C family protein [Clostridiaceae bacterium]MCK9350658.1 C-GCAxxG-C-C family protein [Clostridiales bacterium]
MDLERVLLEYSRQGYACAQIMVKLALDLLGEDNPQLVRAMSGLNAGMGKSGSCCGVLSGGVAALGLFTGRGDAQEVPHEKADEIVASYANWFRDEYGSDRCFDIIGGDFSLCTSVCPGIMEAGYDKMVELLEAYELLD